MSVRLNMNPKRDSSRQSTMRWPSNEINTSCLTCGARSLDRRIYFMVKKDTKVRQFEKKLLLMATFDSFSAVNISKEAPNIIHDGFSLLKSPCIILSRKESRFGLIYGLTHTKRCHFVQNDIRDSCDSCYFWGPFRLQ